MKNGISRRGWLHTTSALVAIGASMLFCCGCQLIPEPRPDPTRYYTLAIPEGETSLGKGILRVGLRVVDLAPHLKKGVMAVRKGEYEIVFNDYARWAEPLDQSLTRAIKTRLQTSQKVNWVAMPPFSLEQERDFDVTVYVARCEGAAQGVLSYARVSATIEVAKPGAETKTIVRKFFSAPDLAWDGRDYASLAAALGTSVGLLAGEVEAALPPKN